MDMLLFALAVEFNLNNEIELIDRIANKDRKAIAELYDRYAKLIYSLIFKIVKKKDDTEEVMQEVFLQIWEKAPSFDANKGNVYVWIVTMTRNKSIDRLRSKRYKQDKLNSDIEPFTLFLPSADADALDQAVASEQAVRLQQALTELPDNQRELLEQSYFEGYSQSELAERHNLPLGTVKTRMRSGLKKLKDVLTENRDT